MLIPKARCDIFSAWMASASVRFWGNSPALNLLANDPQAGKVAGWVINGKLEVGNSGDGSQLLMSLVHLRELWTLWMTTAQQILAFQLNCHPSTLVHPKTTGTLPLSLRSILNSKSSHPTKSQQATAFGPAAIGTQIGGYVPPKAGWYDVWCSAWINGFELVQNPVELFHIEWSL